MSLHFAIILISAALIAPAGFTQEQKPPTLDELVAKNIEAKGGADALRALQSLKLTGKMLVQQGQIELAYNQTKKRPGEVRTEATLQGMCIPFSIEAGRRGSPDKQKMIIEKADTNVPVDEAVFRFPTATSK